METCLFLSGALALLFTSSYPHQVFTAAPWAMDATNFTTCLESLWDLHHWWNEGMLLCGYNYNSIWEPWEHHPETCAGSNGIKIWLTLASERAAETLLVAVCQQWCSRVASPRLLPVVQLLQRVSVLCSEEESLSRWRKVPYHLLSSCTSPVQWALWIVLLLWSLPCSVVCLSYFSPVRAISFDSCAKLYPLSRRISRAIPKYQCLASVGGTNGRRCRCAEEICGQGGDFVEQIFFV